tara:strand:- start:1655 stop:2080 length:426 start_codon:yes stop_codon:yes gene_type:complete
MSLNKKLDQMFEKDYSSDDELDEDNITGGGEAYDTPKAFKKKKKKQDESTFMKLAKELNELNEVNYKAYRADESLTSKQKVNKSIREVASQLFKIERTINQNIKLKTEDGVSSTQYWKSTRGNLRKISERMMRMSERLRRF